MGYPQTIFNNYSASEIEVNSGRIFADLRSMEVNILKATMATEIEESNCIGIYKLGGNITHSRKVSKNFI